MVPALPEDWKARYDAIHNIGVVCLLFKLRTSVTPHFWVNISRARHRHPGHHRILEPAPDRTMTDRLRALLHAGHPPKVRLARQARCSTRPSATCGGSTPRSSPDDMLATKVARLSTPSRSASPASPPSSRRSRRRSRASRSPTPASIIPRIAASPKASNSDSWPECEVSVR